MAKKKTVKKSKKKPAKPTKPPEPKAEPVTTRPANPAFEKIAGENVEVPKKDNRGGARPGAGRPVGLTDEKARVKNLPQYPSIPIRQGCQSLFDLWAAAAKIEQLALTDDEADLLSLPITQLQEFYFPGLLPEIAGTWVMLIFAVTRITKPRIEIVNKVRAERRAAKPGNQDNKDCHYVTEGGLLLHAVEPSMTSDYTKDVSEVTCETCLKLLKKQG